MPLVPFQLHYDLDRRQRLTPHLVIWAPFAPVAAIIIVASLILAIGHSLFWLIGVFVGILFSRGLFVGLLDVLIHPVRHVDIIVQENGLGFLDGGERWWISLDGIIRIGKIREDTWTLQHHNGTVINIPVSVISDEQVAHIRAAAERIRHTTRRT